MAEVTPGAVLAVLSLLLGRVASGQDLPRVELIFLDVGQGDAVVIRSPEGKTVLIDAGRGSIVHQLAGLGIDTIDLAIASHAHADHIGGMEGVLRSFPVRYYMDNGGPHTTATYQSLMWHVERSEITYLEASARTIMLGSVSLRILPPPAQGDHNNRSVGVVVEFGTFKAMLTGDSEWAELRHFLDFGVPDVAVLKAAHHGSYNGVNETWLAATKPEAVVISVGANPYGHPNAEAVRTYEASAAVYRTDIHGRITVRATADGATQVETSKRTVAVPLAPRRAAQPAASGTATVASVGITLSVFADAPGNDHYNLNGEFVVLRNRTNETIRISGWTLCDLARHCYTFPESAGIAAGDTAIVYTGSGALESGRFYMGSGRAVWNNDRDVAVLTDRGGRVVARHVY